MPYGKPDVRTHYSRALKKTGEPRLYDPETIQTILNGLPLFGFFEALMRGDVNGYGLRCDTVGDNIEVAPASLNFRCGRHGEVGRCDLVFRPDFHRTVIKCPHVEHMTGSRINNSN